MPPTAAERLKAKVDAIVVRHGDDVHAADRDINTALDEQEILTTGLLPMNSLLRRRILGAFVRDTERLKRERSMTPPSRTGALCTCTRVGSARSPYG